MKDNKLKTIQYALTKSLPVLFGYLFLGSAFGIMLYDAGYNVICFNFLGGLCRIGTVSACFSLKYCRLSSNGCFDDPVC